MVIELVVGVRVHGEQTAGSRPSLVAAGWPRSGDRLGDRAQLGGLGNLGSDVLHSGSGRRPCGDRPWVTSGGSSSAQMSCAFQQRVRNRQPDGGFDRAGHVAGEHDPLPRALLDAGPAPAPPTAAPGCTGAPARLYTLVAACRSRRSCRGTSRRPGRRCAAPPTGRGRRTGRPAPGASCRSSSRLTHAGLHRDVQRGHRLVEHEHLGVAARAPGRCRCAGAGRRRTRAGTGCRAPGSARPAASSSRTRPGRCPAVRDGRGSRTARR